MNEILIFIIRIVISICLSSIVLIYMKPFFKNILTEICGTETLANFWIAFINIILILIPTIISMFSYPSTGDNKSVFYEIIVQTRWSLIGFLIVFSIIGLKIESYIPENLGKNKIKD